MKLVRVFDLLERLKTYVPKEDILNAKTGKTWQHHSVQSFADHADSVSASLIASGFRKGDRVALMAANMPEWNFVDYGSQQVSMPNVPIYPTISNDDLLFILNHSEARIIFISDRSVYQKLQAIKHNLQYLEQIVSFRPVEGVMDFAAFLEKGRPGFDRQLISKEKQSVSGEDMFTLLYTSGTTGKPKGVMLSHRNILSNLETCRDIAPFTNRWRALSFLPLNHIYERFLNTLYLYHGVSIYYAESIETIGENCREIRPQIFVAVPRVLERVLERITTAGESLKGFKKNIFDWSMDIAERYELSGANGIAYELQRKLADRLVYRKWRAAVGGKIEVIVSGGAALNPRLERIFTCAGLPMLQGYGLTETCVVISVNRWKQKDRMFGTVGVVVENSEVNIAADGEILFKGPSVMMGYYKDPEATAETIDKDGWLHTGDVGTFVNEKFLKITDRKKEIFKNSAGKYIAPVSIENKLKESKYIEQCMVIGEDQKFASALIVCSADYFRDLLITRAIPWTGDESFVENELVKNTIANHVNKINNTLAAHEQVKRYRLLGKSWSVESGEITPKQSLKRTVITEKYKPVIGKIFGELKK